MNMYSLAIREHFRNAGKLPLMIVFFFHFLSKCFPYTTHFLFSSDKTLMSVNILLIMVMNNKIKPEFLVDKTFDL